MKKLYKYAAGLILTGALSVTGIINADAQQRGASHAGGGGNSGGGGGLSFSRGGFGGGSSIGSIRPSYGYGYRSPLAYNYGYGYGLRAGYGYYGYPSLGFYFNSLPFGYYPFYMGASMFYYADGTFYQPYDNGYVVTAPPVGAAIPSLPKGAKSIMIDNQQFFEYHGIYYKVIVNDKGDTVYVVAGKDGVLNTSNDDGSGNAGAAAPQVGDISNLLPANTRGVTLNGRKYFVSEDDIYYEAVKDKDGKVVYRIASVPE